MTGELLRHRMLFFHVCGVLNPIRRRRMLDDVIMLLFFLHNEKTLFFFVFFLGVKFHDMSIQYLRVMYFALPRFCLSVDCGLIFSSLDSMFCPSFYSQSWEK